MLKRAKKELEKAQVRMKKYYDLWRMNVEFEPGDYLYFKLQPYRQKSLKKKFNVKLSQRYYGPFKVLERVGEVAYRLDLPPTSRLHLVFHVSVLKKRVRDPKLVINELPVFDNERRILLQPKATMRCKIWMVLIQWKGLPMEEATWEDYDDIVERFTKFILKGNDVLEDQGNVKDGPRRSTRLLFFFN
ncbi:hypothetical protein ACOSQ4_028232 [Xanthoceras sorbifolium]